ncbi:hypothetical protein LZZ90_10025 [Flavobacterium sp. SM15]|uniref:hypothetical protein n=1 Tax=Flavobacterium sp. SM15 TaxID=2908005 RepID=UPI001EDA4FD4|nr:hypothetical protein [Flavobacterium sp. SM15]MCG2611841.1 hypothetical protein [Flavobacterium sp. SM15]
MKTAPKRICIYPKDVQCITGKSYRQSARLLQKIKEELNKSQSNLVSVEEFCHFTGLKQQIVEEFL